MDTQESQDATLKARRIRFGLYELDLVERELRKQGVKIRLQEQPLQILELLLENPGALVTKEVVRRKIWPADTFVDFDKGLYSAVNRLREALCDEARQKSVHRPGEVLGAAGAEFASGHKDDVLNLG